jgi:hypothetical protein
MRWMCWLVMLAACGGDTPTAYELCDGSEQIRLALTNFGGMMDVTTEFMIPWGYTWLQVDGKCQWYASDTEEETGEWTPIKTGELSTTEAQGLLDDLQVGRWRALVAAADDSPHIDGTSFVLSFAGDTWQAAGDLGKLRDVRSMMSDVVETLRDGAEPLVAETVQVQVLADDGQWVPTSWETTPPEEDLASLVSSWGSEGVVRTGEAAAWRAMRDTFLAEGNPVYEVPRAEQDGLGYFLLVRENVSLLTANELYDLAR